MTDDKQWSDPCHNCASQNNISKQILVSFEYQGVHLIATISEHTCLDCGNKWRSDLNKAVNKAKSNYIKPLSKLTKKKRATVKLANNAVKTFLLTLGITKLSKSSTIQLYALYHAAKRIENLNRETKIVLAKRIKQNLPTITVTLELPQQNESDDKTEV